jgi:hypothetical protein
MKKQSEESFLFTPRPGPDDTEIFCNPSTSSEPRPLVAGLGFLAAFSPDAIAPASISTAFADAIAFSVLFMVLFFPPKTEKNTPFLLCF